MFSIEITRLIFAAVAAVLLGYACYVTAYVKHKNSILDEKNDRALTDKVLVDQMGNPIRSEDDLAFKVRVEKVSSWYFGYRLALVGLIVVSTAVGWAVGWAVGQDYVLTWVEDGVLAASAAIIGGFIVDKHVIHPIADGSFFERVEDPIVQRFLQDGLPAVEDKVKEKKPGFLEKRKAKKEEKEIKTEVPDTPPVIVPALAADIEHMSFDEKVKLIEALRKSL